MRDQVLSIDQMKHLKDLDIDTSEATLYWTRRCHGCKIDDDSTGEWFLSLQKEFQVIGFISYEVIPTFTRLLCGRKVNLYAVIYVILYTVSPMILNYVAEKKMMLFT